MLTMTCYVKFLIGAQLLLFKVDVLGANPFLGLLNLYSFDAAHFRASIKG